MSRALVLNASFEPLGVVSSRRALLLVLNDKADILQKSANIFRSERLEFPEPTVVRLTTFVKVPYGARVALSRRAVFARDNYRCQYCSANAENIDHIIPRSKGGLHEWENVVAACRSCNSRKEDRLLNETSMRLRRMPHAPHSRAWIIAATFGVREEWLQYLDAIDVAAFDQTSLSA